MLQEDADYFYKELSHDTYQSLAHLIISAFRHDDSSSSRCTKETTAYCKLQLWKVYAAVDQDYSLQTQHMM